MYNHKELQICSLHNILAYITALFLDLEKCLVFYILIKLVSLTSYKFKRCALSNLQQGQLRSVAAD